MRLKEMMSQRRMICTERHRGGEREREREKERERERERERGGGGGGGQI